MEILKSCSKMREWSFTAQSSNVWGPLGWSWFANSFSSLRRLQGFQLDWQWLCCVEWHPGKSLMQVPEETLVQSPDLLSLDENSHAISRVTMLGVGGTFGQVSELPSWGQILLLGIVLPSQEPKAGPKLTKAWQPCQPGHNRPYCSSTAASQCCLRCLSAVLAPMM